MSRKERRVLAATKKQTIRAPAANRRVSGALPRVENARVTAADAAKKPWCNAEPDTRHSVLFLVIHHAHRRRRARSGSGQCSGKVSHVFLCGNTACINFITSLTFTGRWHVRVVWVMPICIVLMVVTWNT